MKPRTYKYNEIIEIDWLDIVDENSWLKPEKALRFPACPCRSVGYFLNRDEIVLRVSSTIQTKDADRGVLVIPWGCVQKIRRVSNERTAL